MTRTAYSILLFALILPTHALADSKPTVNEGVQATPAASDSKPGFRGIEPSAGDRSVITPDIPEPRTTKPAPYEPEAETPPGTRTPEPPRRKLIDVEATPGGPMVPIGTDGKTRKPDMMFELPVAIALHGKVLPAGSSFEINTAQPGYLVDRAGGYCTFRDVKVRPFNNGNAPSGPFSIRYYQNDQGGAQRTIRLAAKSGLPGDGLHRFTLRLAEGDNVVRVELDPDQSVNEFREDNNVVTVNVSVNFPCE